MDDLIVLIFLWMRLQWVYNVHNFEKKISTSMLSAIRVFLASCSKKTPSNEIMVAAMQAKIEAHQIMKINFCLGWARDL